MERLGIRARLVSATVIGVAVLAVGGWQAPAPNKDVVDRVDASIGVLHDLTATPDQSIPHRLLDRAEAIVVIPDLVKGGFIVGAKHGRGVISLRHGDRREWSLPGFVAMTGGSIGWQIGVESVDLVLLVMNRHGADDLLSDKFTLGGDASVAAGPVGRAADADTDAKLGSEIYAYSRTRGLFVGLNLEGASLKPDRDSTEDFYGRNIAIRDIVGGPSIGGPVPPAAERFRTTLQNLTNPMH